MKGGKMNYKFLTVFLALFLLTFISAGSEVDYEQVKQNNCIDLTQSCSNCTYMNVTSVKANGQTILLGDYQMDNNGGEYNYTFCNTSTIGDYTWCYEGDVSGGINVPACLGFKVTPTGFIDTLGLYIIFLVIIGAIVTLGFGIKEAWFVVMGGMALLMLGIYSINYGIVGFRDMFMTWGIGLFEIAVGATLAIGAGIQKGDYD
jgi:hypothetical protein